MSRDQEYHARRARAERDVAYRAGDVRVADAHMRLSALHLSRALILEEVDRRLGDEEGTLAGPEGRG
jgi:hypothetical protein